MILKYTQVCLTGNKELQANSYECHGFEQDTCVHTVAKTTATPPPTTTTTITFILGFHVT